MQSKKLVEKLRTLQNENEELGRQLRQGCVEQYEVEIALQRKVIEELKIAIKSMENSSFRRRDGTSSRSFISNACKSESL
ncbi:2297_t:CDS:2 [Entrophospora sp. SA101]|nr:2297_t:CDS:2 [Entrophospora sp. SA101]